MRSVCGCLVIIEQPFCYTLSTYSTFYNVHVCACAYMYNVQCTYMYMCAFVCVVHVYICVQKSPETVLALNFNLLAVTTIYNYTTALYNKVK